MKKLILSLVFTCVASPVYAGNPLKVELSGKLDTSVGYVQQKGYFEQIFEGDNKKANFNERIGSRHKSAIVNDTKLDFNISSKSDLGFTYGGLIRLNADTSVNAANNDDVIADRTMIFIEGKPGRLEGGAYKSAAAVMQVSAASMATAAGGIDGKLPKWFGKGPKISGNGVVATGVGAAGQSFGSRYILFPEAPIDCDCLSFTNKVTYYTPKFKGLQAGLSYSPDTAIHGTVAKVQEVPTGGDGANLKDLIDYAITYENKINKNLDYKVGFNGEIAKAKSGPVARKKLKTWELGAIITYKEFSLGGSYSNWGKSATPVVKAAGKKYGAKYWTAGIGYTKGKFATSLTYFKSYRANVYLGKAPDDATLHDNGYNKLEYVSLGGEYKVTNGLLPYVELSKFTAKDSAPVQSNKGYVFIAGTKLTF